MRPLHLYSDIRCKVPDTSRGVASALRKRVVIGGVYAQGGSSPSLDDEQRIGMDDWEMREDVQREVSRLWDEVTQENLTDLADVEGFQREFLQIHGFAFDGVDYTADVAI